MFQNSTVPFSPTAINWLCYGPIRFRLKLSTGNAKPHFTDLVKESNSEFPSVPSESDNHNTSEQQRYNDTYKILSNLIGVIYCILQLGHLLSQDLGQDKKGLEYLHRLVLGLDVSHPTQFPITNGCFCFMWSHCLFETSTQFKADRLQMIVVAKKYICVATVHQ